MSRLLPLALLVPVLCSSCSWGGPDECAPWGFGTISVGFLGLPDGLPDGGGGVVRFTSTSVQTVETPGDNRVISGTLYVDSSLVTVDAPLVRTTYFPTPSAGALCLTPRQSASLTVSWAPVPDSHRVWVLDGSGATPHLAGLLPESLGASGAVVPSPVTAASVGVDLAFDQQGNLWTAGGAAGDAPLVRLPAGRVGAGGPQTPDRGLAVKGLSCSPAFSGLAFDAAGNLYAASACRGVVLRLPRLGLAADAGVVTPELVLGDLTSPRGLAFDGRGNLFVADPGALEVVQYQAAALAGPSPTPSARWKAKATDNPADFTLLAPARLAFDLGGTLWVNDVSGTVLYGLSTQVRFGSGTVTVVPSQRFTFAAGTQLQGLAFDGDGGLWLGSTPGAVGRLDALQLAAPPDAGIVTTPATVVSSPELGRATAVALYPAPVGLPLYHALPVHQPVPVHPPLAP